MLRMRVPGSRGPGSPGVLPAIRVRSCVAVRIDVGIRRSRRGVHGPGTRGWGADGVTGDDPVPSVLFGSLEGFKNAVRALLGTPADSPLLSRTSYHRGHRASMFCGFGVSRGGGAGRRAQTLRANVVAWRALDRQPRPARPIQAAAQLFGPSVALVLRAASQLDAQGMPEGMPPGRSTFVQTTRTHINPLCVLCGFRP